MTSYTNDEALYKAVLRCGNDRLIPELRIGQRILTEEQIKGLSRVHLVAYVCSLRKGAGLESAVKGLVEN